MEGGRMERRGNEEEREHVKGEGGMLRVREGELNSSSY